MDLRKIMLLVWAAALSVTAIPALALGTVSEPIPPQVSEFTETINLNNATADELMTLPGIGASKAQAIIAYRDKMGGFVEVEQLTEVRGIGDKLLAKIQSRVTVR